MRTGAKEYGQAVRTSSAEGGIQVMVGDGMEGEGGKSCREAQAGVMRRSEVSLTLRDLGWIICREMSVGGQLQISLERRRGSKEIAGMYPCQGGKKEGRDGGPEGSGPFTGPGQVRALIDGGNGGRTRKSWKLGSMEAGGTLVQRKWEGKITGEKEEEQEVLQPVLQAVEEESTARGAVWEGWEAGSEHLAQHPPGRDTCRGCLQTRIATMVVSAGMLFQHKGV